MLADGPLPVGELARALPVSRPAVSQHLKVLKTAGLVTDHASGTRRMYRLEPDGVRALRGQLDHLWGRALQAYSDTIIQMTEEGPSMSDTRTDTSLSFVVTVPVPATTAFDVFVERFDRIKPREHNLLDVPIAETVFEPRVGGHIYDRGTDGSECRWSRVLAYEPPNRLLFSWDIGPTWQIETDPAYTSEVEVRFIAEASDRTRVELEHRNIDRHGEGWPAVTHGVGGDGGWPQYLQRYAGEVGA